MNVFEQITQNSTLPVEPGVTLFDHLQNPKKGATIGYVGTDIAVDSDPDSEVQVAGGVDEVAIDTGVNEVEFETADSEIAVTAGEGEIVVE